MNIRQTLFEFHRHREGRGFCSCPLGHPERIQVNRHVFFLLTLMAIDIVSETTYSGVGGEIVQEKKIFKTKSQV